MPTYRLTAPDGTVELLEADTARVEGVHTVLRGTALVIGRPREVVVRRAPSSVRVEAVDDAPPVDGPSLVKSGLRHAAGAPAGRLTLAEAQPPRRPATASEGHRPGRY